LVVTFNANATLAAASAIVQNLTYQNDSLYQADPSRLIYVKVSEGVPMDYAPQPAFKAVHMLCPDSLDVMLVIDRSGSMGVAPPGTIPSMDYAKQTAANFLNFLIPSDDLVGLVSFSSEATLDTALTTLDTGLTGDYDLVRTKISQLTPDGTTAIGDAIQLARSKLEASPRFHKALSVILVLSDGVNNAGSAWPPAAAAIAKAEGIRVISVALSSDGNAIETLREVASARDQDVEEFDFYTTTSGSGLCAKYTGIAHSLCRYSDTWVSAGPDQTLVAANLPITTPRPLTGTVNGELCDPILTWSLVSGPGTATFGSASSLATTVQFRACFRNADFLL
jgi:hypothetical protein